MRTQNAASPDDIDLASIGAAVKKSLPRIAVASLVIGLGTFGVLSLMTPKYTSQAQLEIRATGIRDPLASKADGPSYSDVQVVMDKEAIGTHVRALMSNDVALKLAREKKLALNPEFNSALPSADVMSGLLRQVGIGAPRAGETDEDRVLSAYYKALRVFNVKETRGISVEFSASDPKFAADVANRVSEIYRDGLSDRTIVETEDATEKLKPQLEKLIREVAEAEGELARFRGQSDRFVGGREKTGLSEQQLADLTTEMSKAAIQRSEADARASSAREMMARGTAESLPDVQKSTLIPRLVEQRVRIERQIAELSATLLPAHPRMKQMVADLGGLKKQITVEVRTIVDGLEREAKVAAQREEGIKRRLDDVKTRMVNTGPADVKVAALESQARLKRAELERLQKQYEAARTTAASQAVPAEVRIVSRALPSSEKAWPKTSLITPLVMLFSALLGLAWTITRGLFSDARRSGGGRVEPRMPLAAQAAPQPAPQARLATAAPVAEPERPAAETSTPAAAGVGTIEQIAADVARRTEGQAGFRLLVAGESATIDASVEALGLARGLAAAGRQVVLVDWNQGESNLPGLTKVSAAPGVAELMSGAASFEDVIQHAGDSGVHVIAGGAASTEAIASDPDRVNLLLDALDEAYDQIVVTGPFAAVRDLFAAIQGRFDCGVMVTDSRRRTMATDEAAGSFLGFDVADLEIIRCDRAADSSVMIGRRPPAPKPGRQPEARA